MTREKEIIFRGVFGEILDYFDVERRIQWALDVHDRMDQERKIISTKPGTTDKGVWFVYAMKLARIIAEFGKLRFDEVGPNDVEIELEKIGMTLGDIEGFLKEGIDQDRREMLSECNVVEIKDIWKSMLELKADIYKHLVGNDGMGDPMPVYRSLLAIFEYVGDDGEMVLPNQSFSRFYQEDDAFAYVMNRFVY